MSARMDEKKRKEIECWKVSAPVPFFSLFSSFSKFYAKKRSSQAVCNVYMILLEGTEIIAEIKGEKKKLIKTTTTAPQFIYVNCVLCCTVFMRLFFFFANEKQTKEIRGYLYWNIKRWKVQCSENGATVSLLPVICSSPTSNSVSISWSFIHFAIFVVIIVVVVVVHFAHRLQFLPNSFSVLCYMIYLACFAFRSNPIKMRVWAFQCITVYSTIGMWFLNVRRIASLSRESHRKRAKRCYATV